MATVVKDLGAVTAYAYAVAGGYSGTEAEFEALLGNIAEDLSEIENLSVTVTTLPAGSSATASYSNGVLSLGIPKGDKGDKGDTGATGATGPTGNGISTITKTGTSGLVDTYTITFTNGDTTTFTVTNGEDGEVTTAQMNAAIETALEDYAKVDGSYSSLTAGNAEQLVSTVGVNDKTPYLFRTTGGSADVGDRVKLSEITGGTVAWNQMIYNGNFSSTDGWRTEGYQPLHTLSASGNVLSYALGSTPTAFYNMGLRPDDSYKFSVVAGHKYLVHVAVNAPHTENFVVRSPNIFGGSGQYDIVKNVVANQWCEGNLIYQAANTTTTYFYICPKDVGSYSSGDVIQYKDYCMFDLTAMFGSTIADYIYGLEQNTAGAGVAWFRKLFPKPYYAYDAGTLMSVKTSAHKEVGFNQFDVSTAEDGYMYNKAGVKSASVNPTRSASQLIPVIPNTSYFLKAPYYANVWNGVFFDANKEPLNDAVQCASSGNKLFTTPGNCYYIALNMLTADKGDICINLHWDGERDGEYEPYEANIYALDDVELRGIPKLDASNNLYYDGDSYAPDGTVTRKYGVITLDGTKTYGWSSNNNLATITVTNGIVTDGTTQYYAYTFSDNPALKNSSWAGRAANAPCIGMFYGASLLFIKSTDIESAEDAKTYFTNHPTTVLYVLAAPTTESADPYQETQVCNDFGTEEFVDERTVPMPVGNSALYQANLRAKLEMAPDSPDGDGDYLVRQTDGLNEYVAVSDNATISGLATRCPSCPTDTDGTFVLKATVSSGAVTYAWTAES